MKRLYVIVVALIGALVCIVGLDFVVKQKIDANIEKAVYDNNITTRNCSDYAMEKIIDDNSIVVLGSSELSASDNLAYPPSLFNRGFSDFNMILMGAGYLQSLSQAINVGALQNNIKNGKVVLIVSPQWFSEGGVSAEAFSSRFEEANFVEFLQNDNISKKIKISVSNRVNELLVSDPITLERIQKYEEVYLYHTLNPVTYLEMSVYSAFRNAKTRFELVDEFENLPSIDKSTYVETEKINFDELLPQAEKLGEETCTTNDFGVYDEYYNTYIKDGIESSRNSSEGVSYASSIEYDDFRLFLDICRETGIEPLIISVPVNGRWYDYTGFSKADRNTYYQNIRDICKQYGVKLADFSEKEYELYYLKDVMHMGWKGWVYLDNAVYNFYKGDEIVDNTSYEELVFDDTNLSEGASDNGNRAYSFYTSLEGNAFNSVVVTLKENNTIIDEYSATGVRTGMYLHSLKSGFYTIRFRANSNMQDEYVNLNVYLEKDAVYKVYYNIDSFGSNQIDISGISFSKVEY